MCVGVGWVVLVKEGGGGVGCSGSIRPNMCKPVACVLFRLFRASMVGAFSVFLGFWVLFYEFFVCEFLLRWRFRGRFKLLVV